MLLASVNDLGSFKSSIVLSVSSEFAINTISKALASFCSSTSAFLSAGIVQSTLILISLFVLLFVETIYNTVSLQSLTMCKNSLLRV